MQTEPKRIPLARLDTPLEIYPELLRGQKLLVKFTSATCGYTFRKSASGKSFSWDGNKPGSKDNNRIGDDTSGWEIENVSIDTWYAMIH